MRSYQEYGEQIDIAGFDIQTFFCTNLLTLVEAPSLPCFPRVQRRLRFRGLSIFRVTSPDDRNIRVRVFPEGDATQRLEIEVTH